MTANKIPAKILHGAYIARITLFADKLYIRSAQEFVLYFARFFGFDERDLTKLELATEEAVLSTIENSFEEGDSGSFDVKVGYRPGAFVISIEDQGLPADAERLEKQENSALGMLLMRNLTDEFNIVNLGREGKRIELVKYIQDTSIAELLSTEEINGKTDTADVAEDRPTMRLIRPEDAPMLARLAYRVYGYTYASVFYYPDKLRELIENGLINSVVSINNEGEIVGNLSLFFEHQGAKVADSGAAMIDPRYRGHSLFKESKKFLQKYAEQNGMYGIYSEAVTIHPFTQQGNMSLGAKETGIMLAYASENLTFKKINNDKKSEQRQAVALFYLKTNKEPRRKVFLNEKFFPLLKMLIEHNELDRELIMISDNQTPMAEREQASVTTIVKPDLNIAVIMILQHGADVIPLVAQQLRELCLKKIETIYLEIPVDEAYATVVAREMNKKGFMLSGIIPELRNGDILKMQYLNNVYVNPDKIVIASPLHKEILGVIMQDYQ